MTEEHNPTHCFNTVEYMFRNTSSILRTLTEEYENIIKDIVYKETFTEFIISEIKKELEYSGMLAVYLGNGRVCDKRTYGHYFVIRYTNKFVDIVRTESYIDLYYMELMGRRFKDVINN